MPIFDDDLVSDPSGEEQGNGEADAALGLGQPQEEATVPEQTDAPSEDGIPQPDENTLSYFQNDPTKYQQSYKNLQAAFTRTSQELAALKSQLPQSAPRMPMAPQMPVPPMGMPPMGMPIPPAMQMPPAMPNQFVNPLDFAVEQKVNEKLMQAAAVQQMQQARQEQLNHEAETIAMAYPDFAELAQDMQALVAAQPWIEQLPNPVETAYWMARSRRSQMEAAGVVPPSKLAARMPGNQAQRRIEKEPTPEERIIQATFGEQGKPQGIFG